MSAREEHVRMAETIKQLRTVDARWAEAIKHPSVDKKAIGFNVDNRFSAFKVEVTFDSYTGVFGHSSCQGVIRFADVALVRKAFLAYLNEHYGEIFAAMADALEAQATALREARIAELEEELAQLRDEGDPEWNRDDTLTEHDVKRGDYPPPRMD